MFCISDIFTLTLPGDSSQTPARSICLKFAGPTIRITHNFPRLFSYVTNTAYRFYCTSTCSEPENHNTSLNKHYITTAETFSGPSGVIPRAKWNRCSTISRFTKKNQRTKMAATDITGRAREFCWLLGSDWTREL